MEEVLFEEKEGWGIITLNRPKAFNALTWNMCRLMLARLKEWVTDDEIRAVLIRGEGEKAFCAGGDIRWLYETSQEDPHGAAEFFRTEYNLNSLIHHYPKPYVALMHGVVMGGGVGVSISASTRIVSDTLTWAMPETGIGMVPDVGGSYFLPRLGGGLGLYLALTGHRLNGTDSVYAGIATHHVPYEQFEALEEALAGIGKQDLTQKSIDACVATFDKPGDTALKDSRAQIDQQFSVPQSVEDIIEALGREGGAFAEKTLQSLGRMSPTALKLTYEEVQRGADMTFDECLIMEFALVRKIMEGPDFHEGVRAQIIDKDRNPKWSPEDLSGVTDDLTAPYFADLGQNALRLDHGVTKQAG
ncbi:MAG: enoyl-CoA hydratase/isomerase family protein [Aquisalinus sp.]|nr:enoyl-CoA hydratase/isomerase family protein [Aquisalinus sp.]